MSRLLLLVLMVLAVVAPARAQVDARMLRHPDVSRTHIVFVYAGDLWVVPRDGGTAQRLSSPKGEEAFPRFSPDGSRIAFSAAYDGNTDVYVVPTRGGEVRRLTSHPMPDRLVDWAPDGKALLFASSRESGRQRFNQLFRVPVNGGLPEKLPLAYAEFGAYSPDGRQIAFTTLATEFRTWKRYRGGMNPDIWLYDFTDGTARNLTRSDAGDIQPMWHGRSLYFVSDRGAEHRNNLWAYDFDADAFRQITRFDDFDVRFPAIGPLDIVFEAGGRLYRYDLEAGRQVEVKVEVTTDRATRRPQVEKVDRLIQNAWPSPSGKRVVFEARGELFSVPAEHGPILNLTHSSGVAERYPTWSPDGKNVAFFSDRSGEYELTLLPAEGGTETTLTATGPGFRYRPYWSPDSRKIAFIDQTMTIHVYNLDTKKTVTVDRAHYYYQGSLHGFSVSWSPDSRWMAYARDTENRNQAVFLFDTRSGRTHPVTSGYYSDDQPTFDPEGRYLFVTTNRAFTPIYSDLDNTWIYPNTTQIAAIALRRDVSSLLVPRNDVEGDGKAGEGEKAPEKKDSDRKTEPTPVEIDLEGLEQRLEVLPPKPGNYGYLQAVRGKVLYRRAPRTGSAEEEAPVVYYDLEAREEKTVLGNADGFIVTADGQKLLAYDDNRYALLEIKPDQKFDKPLRTAEMEAVIDPTAEWRQLFVDAWRLQRDFFYDPNLHGVDWAEIRTHYGRLLDDAVTRWDVDFILGEMISELNASHTYRGGGDVESPETRGVGLLGVDWALDGDAYRIARIIEGAPWDAEVRSPLRAPGVDVKEGSYVLAVNGVPLDPTLDPWAAFQGLAGQIVTLTVNDRPTMNGARQVTVQTMADETRLRHLAWIEANRRRVDEATGGRAGYIYVPSTGVDGQTELVRQFAAQFHRDALVIDERFNSGGQIPDRFVELLNRPIYNYWAVRDGTDWQWPPVAHQGPKVMLINGWSGSGGDAFPRYFRAAGLGPLIGTRTWGGLIGISGAPPLVDGGTVTVPTFRMYYPDGTWFEEGHGVEPDIEVIDDPAELARGRDPQLERAIEEVLRRLETDPPARGKRPPFEDRSGVAERER